MQNYVKDCELLFGIWGIFTELWFKFQAKPEVKVREVGLAPSASTHFSPSTNPILNQLSSSDSNHPSSDQASFNPLDLSADRCNSLVVETILEALDWKIYNFVYNIVGGL